MKYSSWTYRFIIFENVREASWYNSSICISFCPSSYCECFARSSLEYKITTEVIGCIENTQMKPNQI